MKKEEERFHLTKYTVLQMVCDNYGIDTSHLTPKIVEHFFDDLMKSLEKQGYVQFENNKKGEN